MRKTPLFINKGILSVIYVLSGGLSDIYHGAILHMSSSLY